MRLPNGYGSITKLSGNRRRPYMVRITTGYTDEGKQIMNIIGYYATKKEALSALAEHNENPYSAMPKDIIFEKVFEKFCKEKYYNKDKELPAHIKAAYAWCAPVHDMKFCEVKFSAIQNIVDNCDRSRQTKKNIKILYNKLSNYCVANGVIAQNYAAFIELPPEEVSTAHTNFTDKELEILWNNSNDFNVQIVLILCYTGMRPSELLDIKIENVHLDERYMIGGMKTAAGKNRVIPISKKILPFITELYKKNQENEFLIEINEKYKRAKYDTLRRTWFAKAMQLTHLNHTPHDGRHTCATLLNNAGVNATTIKFILGHSSRDVTEKVYTHKSIEQLIEAIDLI